VAAAASAALALTLGNLLSSTIDRPRPFVAHPELVHLFVKHVADAGFPSDHATASFAIATAVFLRNRAWGAVILLLATVLAIGRVGMGVHYPSDVLAGAALGAVSALLLWALPIRARIDALADWFAGLADRTERRALAVIGSDS
jgi:undecaprenyl-diphosphatase